MADIHYYREVMDLTLALLAAENLAGMLKLLDSYEAAGWIGFAEAVEWRRRIEGWERFQTLDPSGSASA